MFVDALLPAASELVMVYAGALAAGVFASQDVVLFGKQLDSGWPAYLAVALAGTIGYTLGAILGWAIGFYGGRPYVERHGRWLHLDTEKLARADAWFERWGDEAVLIGRVTPVVRSFVSIPAGAFGVPFVRYTVLTAIGSVVWCLVFGGIGWGVGASWSSFDHGFHYVEYALVAIIVVAVAVVVIRHRRSTTMAGGRADSPR